MGRGGREREGKKIEGWGYGKMGDDRGMEMCVGSVVGWVVCGGVVGSVGVGRKGDYGEG